MSKPRVIPHFIDGRHTAGASKRSADGYNPSSGKLMTNIPLAGKEDIERAVASAHAAFPLWSATSPLERMHILFKFKALLEQCAEELAGIITREHGKVFSEAMDEVSRGLEIVAFTCGIAQLLKGQYSEQGSSSIDSWGVRQALGVVAGITPFNLPMMVPCWMFPVAIACGNTFVLKPSERNPSCAIRLAELLTQAGLPDGVFNVVQGDKQAVEVLIEHPAVQALSFVGSTSNAEYIYAKSTALGKRAQALGSAKNHMVIMPDADLNLATEALMAAAFGSAGENCMAVSVAVAVGDAADPLIERLAPRIQALKVMDGMSNEAEMGPLITAQHRTKVIGYIDDGVASGATLVVDGRKGKIANSQAGFFLSGSLFDNVKPQMNIYREEIFGPVLCVVRVPNFAQAVELINQHEFGHSASCFTADGGVAREFARRIQMGMVGINVAVAVPVAWHSGGGWKRSMFGDHHVYGEEGVRFYTRYKNVMQCWPDRLAKNAKFTPPGMN
jgi:malonate-semialdehyde dehydrogenase (acetylating)/methylmalonate-semialdehyde dehydrogenase